jgi:hypothetical protein
MFDQRIWDLKTQACAWAQEKLGELESAGQPYHGSVDHWTDIRLAELIVKECANWIKNTDANPDIGEEDARALLEHFGIEKQEAVQ